jgi:hypothetical protein
VGLGWTREAVMRGMAVSSAKLIDLMLQARAGVGFVAVLYVAD